VIYKEEFSRCEIRQNKKYSLKPVAKRRKKKTCENFGKDLFQGCLLVVVTLMLLTTCLYLLGVEGGALDHALGLTK
jgi:hypothetical protein